MHHLLQEKIKYFVNNQMGNTQWITVYGYKKIEGYRCAFGSGLLPEEQLASAMTHASWDHSYDAGYPGFVQTGDDVRYEKYEDSGYEMLVIERDFFGIYPSYADISQEFILLNNLHYDEKTRIYTAVKDNGETEEVVKIYDEYIDFSKKYLMKYASAKQKRIMLYFDVRAKTNDTFEGVGVTIDYTETNRTSSVYYEFWVGQQSFSLDSEKYSVLMGKKVLPMNPIELCGFWPYESEKKYHSFIIGIGENGNPIEFTSDPSQLNNYFGSNPNNPHYLTPIFFRREVLQKYYGNPKLYTITDAYLSCSSLWGMSIDNHQAGYISAYLGDLGRDLPEDEQFYWKSYNIMSDGTISDVKMNRDFFGLFSDPTISDLKFKSKFTRFNEMWQHKYSWDLFIKLSEGDQYLFTTLRLPLNDLQNEFDPQITALVKLIIDSINEAEVSKLLPSNLVDITGSINLMERWLESQGISDYQQHIGFLRDLQTLRSTGTSHRKGSKYIKALAKFDEDITSLIRICDKIFVAAIDLLDFLAKRFTLGDI